jgi:hypothetical protein
MDVQYVQLISRLQHSQYLEAIVALNELFQNYNRFQTGIELFILNVILKRLFTDCWLR